MKKLLLYILAVCTFHIAAAQTFSLNPRVVKVQGPNNLQKLEAPCDFTNTGTDTIFEWQILEITAPSGFAFGLCDPFNCLTDLTIGSKSSFNFATNKTGQFIGDFVLNNKSGIGTAKVLVYAKTNPSNADTLTFIMNSWVTAVKEVAPVSKEFTFFPNPVKDRLQIKYNTREPMAIEIYNVLGNRVKSFVHTGFESDINVGDLQNGIYFIRFRDGNHTVSKPFTKSE